MPATLETFTTDDPPFSFAPFTAAAALSIGCSSCEICSSCSSGKSDRECDGHLTSWQCAFMASDELLPIISHPARALDFGEKAVPHGTQISAEILVRTYSLSCHRSTRPAAEGTPTLRRTILKHGASRCAIACAEMATKSPVTASIDRVFFLYL